jgi:hypothetical protein
MKYRLSCSTAPRTADSPRQPLLRVAWRFGDAWTRFFVILLLVGYLAPLLPAVWLFARFGYQFEHSFGIAWIGGILFGEAFVTPIINAKVLREYLARGWAAPDEEYYREAIRYVEEHGKGGRMPNDIAWGLAYWLIFYGTMGLAVLWSRTLSPVLGPLTPFAFAAVDFPIIFACFAGYRIRARNQLRAADEKGFRLSELLPRARRGSRFRLLGPNSAK